MVHQHAGRSWSPANWPHSPRPDSGTSGIVCSQIIKRLKKPGRKTRCEDCFFGLLLQNGNQQWQLQLRVIMQGQDKFREPDEKAVKQLSHLRQQQSLHDAPLDLLRLVRPCHPFHHAHLWSRRWRKRWRQRPRRSQAPRLVLFRISAGIPPTFHLSRRRRHSGRAIDTSFLDSRWQQPSPCQTGPPAPSPRNDAYGITLVSEPLPWGCRQCQEEALRRLCVCRLCRGALCKELW